MSAHNAWYKRSVLPTDIDMAKTGRNEPCTCGSGKKYKQCCLAKDEAEAIAAAPKAETKAMRRENRDAMPMHLADEAELDDGFEEMAALSDSVSPLIKAGQIDEAEKVARLLLERFPQVHDGLDSLAMVYEARGDNKRAAEYYRKTADFIRQNPDLYDPGFENFFLEDADRLDPPAD